MKRLLTYNQYLGLTLSEYTAFFEGLKAREKYKSELISLGLENQDIQKLVRLYYKRNTTFIPERFIKTKTKKNANTFFGRFR